MGLRILYGVNGEGLGHATRSQVVAEALLVHHDVRVVTSGGALAYLRERLPRVEQVFGPSRVYGMRDLPEPADGPCPVTFRPRAEAGFLER